MPANILIVDDEEHFRKLLTRILSLEGFKVSQAGSLQAARHSLANADIDILLCDVKLPDGNGVDFVKEAKDKYPVLEIILLTAFGNIPDGVRAIQNGGFDYITKGDDNDRIISLLYRAFDKILTARKSSVKIQDRGVTNFDQIIGTSPAIKEIILLAKKIATSDANVLLLGETGTGKEIFANTIHTNSRRSSKRFVAINCSAFPKDLLEGELFGHKAGAFTGAVKDKKGLIELADEGTLFLDEIGDLQIDLQAKLLRVIENGEFIKLGDARTSTVDVRFISATNRDLNKKIESGDFREDLYYRLNVLTIQLPPLRERVEDIPILIKHFLSVFSKAENKPDLVIGKSAVELLKKFSWRGNIRELKNVLQRAVILAEGVEILPAHLPYEIQKQSDSVFGGLSLSGVERDHIQKVLHYTKGNKTRAAECMGIGLTTLYRKMQEYHISK